MSFESGRKLGLISSLIYVSLPVIEIAALATIFISALANISASSYTTPIYGTSIVFSAIMIAVAVVYVAGYVLFILSMHRLSKYYNSPGIFRNILIAVILNIVGGIVAFIMMIMFALTTLPTTSPTTVVADSTYSSYASFFLGLIGVVVFAFVLMIVSSVLYMRAFHELADKSGENNFRTTGTLYLVGTVLTIVIVGALLVWIAWIFAAIGFRALKPQQQPAASAYYPQTSPQSMAQTKRCPNCGAENNPSNLYCRSCGHALQ